MNTAILEEAFQCVDKQLSSARRPRCALVLGSGWGEAVADFDVVTSMDYADIPHIGATTVESHAGRLLLTDCSGMSVLIFQGRRHWYEGGGWEPVAIPVYISLRLGAGEILLTNAAGSLRKNLSPGDFVTIDDHVNLIGSNPLIGTHDPRWGPRFPDMTAVYDHGLRHLLDNAAVKARIELRHGVYAATAGPIYETPTESALLRSSGVDIVGMSTVPEAILAHAAGMKVAGLSCVTNFAASAECEPLSHKSIVQIAADSVPRMKSMLGAFLKLLAASNE